MNQRTTINISKEQRDYLKAKGLSPTSLLREAINTIIEADNDLSLFQSRSESIKRLLRKDSPEDDELLHLIMSHYRDAVRLAENESPELIDYMLFDILNKFWLSQVSINHLQSIDALVEGVVGGG